MNREPTRGTAFWTRLSSTERDRLLAEADLEEMPARRVLLDPGQAVDRIYFPISGMVSLVTLMSDGGAVEVVTVGKEGARRAGRAGRQQGQQHVRRSCRWAVWR